MAENDTSLYPPSLRVKSEVWKYFGYRKNADGSICDNGFPVCKKCGRQVAAQGRNTSNMFSHLRSNHPIQFREIRVSFLNFILSSFTLRKYVTLKKTFMYLFPLLGFFNSFCAQCGSATAPLKGEVINAIVTV